MGQLKAQEIKHGPHLDCKPNSYRMGWLFSPSFLALFTPYFLSEGKTFV